MISRRLLSPPPHTIALVAAWLTFIGNGPAWAQAVKSSGARDRTKTSAPAKPDGARSAQPSGDAQSEKGNATDSQRAVDAGTLAKEDYATRQRATMQLWRERETRRQEVQDATRHPDPEVADRARWILNQWRRGAVGGNPLSLTGSDDDASAIRNVLDQGRFVAARVAVEESAGTVEFERIKNRVAKLVKIRFPLYVKLAVQQNKERDLLELVDSVGVDQEMAVCRVGMMQLLGDPIDDNNLLPSASSSWVGPTRELSLTQLRCMLGQDDEALEEALASKDHELIRVVRMLRGQWDELAKLSLAAAEAAPNIHDQCRHWAWTLVSADRSSNDPLSRRASDWLIENANLLVAEAEPMPEELQKRHRETLEICWKALTLHGEVDEALHLLAKIATLPGADSSDCVSVAMAASRPQFALDVLGYKMEEVDLKLDQWISKALTAQAEIGPDDLAPEAGRLLSFVQVLLGVGRYQDARRICEQLTRFELTIDRTNETLRDRVLRTLLISQRDDWVRELAVRPDERRISYATRYWVAESLSVDAETILLLMNVCKSLFSSLSYHDQFQLVCSLVSGEIPDQFDPDRDFDRIFERLSDARQMQPLGGQIANTRVRLNQHIVDMFMDHGRYDLAKRGQAILIATGNIETILKVAQSQLDQGNNDAAAEYLEKVWQIAERGVTINRFIQADAGPKTAAKALVGQWILAKRNDDPDTAENLLYQLRLTLCSPSTSLRNEIAEYLREQGENELASETLETLLSVTAFGSSEATEFYDVARNYSASIRENDIISAAQWFDLAVGGTLETTTYRASAYVSLPLFVRRWMLEATLKSKDAASARKHIERIERLDPLNIDYAERLLPELRESGMGEIADEAFDALFDRGLEYLRQFPTDATSLNNLAWSGAMNERRLEESLALSERSVFWEPDSPIYRDTLAELLFALERPYEALLIEEACLLDDPGEWHFHEQIKKYREAAGLE